MHFILGFICLSIFVWLVWNFLIPMAIAIVATIGMVIFSVFDWLFNRGRDHG